jgi:hypothetical protein
MISSLLLFDVAPDPVRGPLIGITGLILIVVIVLMLAAIAMICLPAKAVYEVPAEDRGGRPRRRAGYSV